MNKSFWEDFKAFALKGNVVDMAVGVIIGGAFGKIVASIVADVLTPIISLVIGGIHFKELKYVIREAVEQPGKDAIPAITINYGNFIQAAIDFIIIAFSIFIVIKIISKLSLKKQQEQQAAPPPPPAEHIVLLTQIRDLLKEQKQQEK